MKSVPKSYILFVFLAFLVVAVDAQSPAVNTNDPQIKEFEKRAKAYVKERERIRKTLPSLSKKSTPEEITAHESALLKAVQEKRMAFKQGTIYTPEASAILRTAIVRELDRPERADLRKTIFEAENKAVQVRVNYPYPESQEQVEMPATLLMVLPQLPKELRYRFVGRHMLLVDRTNNLIVDYMTNAVP